MLLGVTWAGWHFNNSLHYKAASLGAQLFSFWTATDENELKYEAQTDTTEDYDEYEEDAEGDDEGNNDQYKEDEYTTGSK